MIFYFSAKCRNAPRIILWSLISCNLAMMVLAIATNLLSVFLTAIAIDLGKGTSLSAEQLGRIGAVTFSGLVGGILLTGPLADHDDPGGCACPSTYVSWRTLALGLSPMPMMVGLALWLLPKPSLIESGGIRISNRELVRKRFFLLDGILSLADYPRGDG